MVRQERIHSDLVALYTLNFTLQAWGDVMDTLEPYLSFGSEQQAPCPWGALASC